MAGMSKENLLLFIIMQWIEVVCLAKKLIIWQSNEAGAFLLTIICFEMRYAIRLHFIPVRTI